MKKIILAVVIIAVVGFILMRKSSDAPDVAPSPSPTEEMSAGMVQGESASTTPVMEDGTVASGVAEFAMDSFMNMEGTKRVVGFSLKEMTVKKGDKVKITVTNTAGTHDFNIDEFNVHVDTPEGKATVIEFVADKVGDFEYYCSKFTHRQMGQVGKLHVTE